jgi:SAM-dependent methyltransferase
VELGEHEFLVHHGDRDWWQVGMRACTLAMVPREAAGGRALDLGSGCGWFVRDLRRVGLDATGVEMSEYAVAHAELTGQTGRIALGRLQDALAAGDPLDLISCLDVLPHRTVDEDEVLGLAAARLRPGGWLLLRLPAYAWLYGHHDRYVHQLRRYSVSDVSALADRAGLEVARTSFANWALFGVVLAARAAERLRPPAEDHSSNRVWPASVNAGLRAVLLAEARLIRRGVRLPWGSSLLVLLRRPA